MDPMQADPVPLEVLQQFVADCFGLDDADDVVSLTIDRRGATLVMLRRDEAGRVVALPNDTLATVTVTAPVEDG